MPKKSQYGLMIGAIIAFGAVGCTQTATSERMVQEVSFTGVHTDITGTLSDGTPFAGKGWFREGSTRGTFCMQTASMVCSGSYAAGLSRRISGEFVCSNGTTGNYVTERIASNDYVVPVKGTGMLSDGRTAVAEFSPLKEFGSKTTCFVPPS